MTEEKVPSGKERQNQEKELKSTLRIILETNAYERLNNVSIANNELFITAAQHVMGAFRKVRRKIKDDEVKMILTALKERTEKKTSITFNRK